jgi:hypothetical protein
MAGGDYGALRIAERAAIRVRSVGKEVSVLVKSKCECAYLFAPATKRVIQANSHLLGIKVSGTPGSRARARGKFTEVSWVDPTPPVEV